MQPTIKIRNKRTGEVREISTDQIADYGIDPATAVKMLESQQQLKRISEGKPKEASEEELKKTKAKADAERIVTQLENAYFSGNQGKGLAYGKAGGFGKKIEGALSVGEEISPELEDLSAYNALVDSVRPTFARAAGDSGNFSLPEQKAAVANIPRETQTLGQAKKYFAALRGKFGLPQREYTEIQKNYSQYRLQNQSQVQAAVPQQAQTQYPRESIVTQPQAQVPQQLPQRMDEGEQARMVQQKAAQLDPLSQLLAPVAMGPIGGLSEGITGLLTPTARKAVTKHARGQDVSTGEALAGGGEVLATAIPFAPIGKLGLAGKAALAGGVRGVTQENESLLGRVGEGAKEAAIGGLIGAILAPKQTLGNVRNLGVNMAKDKGVSFSGEAIAKAGEEYAKRIPLAESVSRKVIPNLKKETLSPQQLIDRMKEWGPLAYTKAGDVKSTAQANFFNTLYGEARRQLAEKAGVASAAQSGLSTLNKVGRVGSNVARGAIFGGAAAAAGGGVLSKIFPGLFER